MEEDLFFLVKWMFLFFVVVVVQGELNGGLKEGNSVDVESTSDNNNVSVVEDNEEDNEEDKLNTRFSDSREIPTAEVDGPALGELGVYCYCQND